MYDKQQDRRAPARRSQGHHRLAALANCHLYKQAGNSIVVPLVRRVGRKIVEALAKTDGFRGSAIDSRRR